MAKKAHQESGRSFPVRVVANATRLRMADDKLTIQLLKQDKLFPPLENSLGDRKAFTRSMLVGGTAHDLRHSEEAVKEIEALADTVLRLLGLPKTAKKGRK